MKYYLAIVFLFVGACVGGSIGYDTEIESWVRGIQNNKDLDDKYVTYPCSKIDIQCIRKFFSTHGHCKPVYGPIPDPLIIEQMLLPSATSNISFTISNVKVRGLNGKITAFYINEKTNNLVIAFEAIDMTLSSPRITFKYNRKNKEPIKLTDAFFIAYTSVTFTATIPNLKNLQLSNADVYAYLDDGDPKFGLGPGVIKSFEPVVLKAFNDLISRIPENAKETLVNQAPNFMKIFIQNNICDFGVQLRA